MLRKYVFVLAIQEVYLVAYKDKVKHAISKLE